MPKVETRGETPISKARVKQEYRRNHGGGYLYVVTNPAWPDFIKIGRTININTRLRSYNTGSPFKDYELFYYRFFTDVCAAEQAIRHFYGGHKFRGEWYQMHPEDAANLIDITATRAIFAGKIWHP